LANIRVIFENNREPAAEIAKKNCGTRISPMFDLFGIREEQGGRFDPISEPAFCVPGARK
jgi:hypothetical protein